jgi:hypothetical protein
VAFTQAYVFDISQTQGEPLPEPRHPMLLQGQAPDGLWDQLAAQVRDAGYELEPGRPSPRRWPVRAMSAPCSYACVRT